MPRTKGSKNIITEKTLEKNRIKAENALKKYEEDKSKFAEFKKLIEEEKKFLEEKKAKIVAEEDTKLIPETKDTQDTEKTSSYKDYNLNDGESKLPIKPQIKENKKEDLKNQTEPLKNEKPKENTNKKSFDFSVNPLFK
tara:strand:- start:5870 stop:6286 length:417 start_codon:yes stop_codon:yes gene_type:complete